MSRFHLAEINIGRLVAPVDDPKLAEFVANLDRINALAEDQSGFVWRLTGEGGDATDIKPVEDDPMIAINMSVWTDLDSLAAFVYRTAHRDVMRRRREWFEALQVYMALWWVPVGHVPTPAEGMARIDMLERMGPTPEAFTFRTPFPAPGVSTITPILDECA
ncbi:MAG TPA: DUF3291 domain-containing protein [Phenylobacterium sp.]|jgi:hypothetical protein